MKIISKNKKIRHKYSILDQYDAGIVLKGSEIKSIRKNGIDLNNAYAIVKKSEIFLLNANVNLLPSLNTFEDITPTRTRKLLFSKKEIKKIQALVFKKKLTLIPIKAYLSKKNILKITIALCRGLKKYDKREILKQRDIKQEMDKKIKSFNNSIL